jgi:hypothetical protein
MNGSIATTGHLITLVGMLVTMVALVDTARRNTHREQPIDKGADE